MTKTLKTFFVIAAAAICMGTTPLAVSYAPQALRTAGQELKAAAEAQKQRAEAQEVADINTAAGYRLKLAGCRKQATDSYLHFLERMSFISECMGRS